MATALIAQLREKLFAPGELDANLSDEIIYTLIFAKINECATMGSLLDEKEAELFDKNDRINLLEQENEELKQRIEELMNSAITAGNDPDDTAAEADWNTDLDQSFTIVG
jgi:uncharacterized protein YccT (UPF0319 family)